MPSKLNWKPELGKDRTYLAFWRRRGWGKTSYWLPFHGKTEKAWTKHDLNDQAFSSRMLTLTLMDGHVRNVVNLNYDIYREFFTCNGIKTTIHVATRFLATSMKSNEQKKSHFSGVKPYWTLQLIHHTFRSASARRTDFYLPPAQLRQEIHRGGITRRGLGLLNHLRSICRSYLSTILIECSMMTDEGDYPRSLCS